MQLTAHSLGLVVNAPEVFANPEFQAWLNDGQPKMTWHNGGIPNEWSDVIVLVDPSLNGEGADSEMPEAIWNQIVELCRQHFTPRQSETHIMVRLTNLRA
ncbi:TPA: hypothetical protein QDB04_000125 [Burkholderia vietnamiensis]|nr:hypothetical protein [Burkholderia vietnamiensis]